jgi:D-sedoheptulose 7-phosphate isomerase
MSSFFSEHFQSHAAAIQESIAALESAAQSAADAIVGSLREGHKVLTFGNGGSSAEASHFAEELVGRYRATRRPFPAMSLSSDSGTVTCISNDFGYGALFERQIEAFLQPGDVAVGLTTSGKSENVVRAFDAARKKDGITIALTGRAGMGDVSVEHVLAVPSDDSAIIQEVHLMLIHFWCESVDKALGGA